jgi:hypothetical protein
VSTAGRELVAPPGSRKVVRRRGRGSAPQRVDVCPLNPGAAGATAWRPARTSAWDRRTTPPERPVVQTGGRRLSEHDAYLVRGDVFVRTPLASSSVAATRQTPQTAVAHPPHRSRSTESSPPFPSPKSSRASTTASTSCQRSSGSSCGRPTRSEPFSTASCVVIRLAPFSSGGLALSEPAQLRRARRLRSPVRARGDAEAGSDRRTLGVVTDHGGGHDRRPLIADRVSDGARLRRNEGGTSGH